MRAAGLRARAVHGYRAKAHIHHLYARHPNRLWDVRATAPNQVWVGDITYLQVASRWCYLAIVMDQYSRRILAWSLTRRRTAAVTGAVLAQAARRRPAAGVIFHSDRGIEYMGAPFCERVTDLGLVQSASVRGPGDNPHAESFFYPEGGADARRSLRHRARTAPRTHQLHPVLQHHPLALRAQLPLSTCL